VQEDDRRPAAASCGEETVRTFLTVFRDAVTLAVTSALIFLIVSACTS
jgi:hypothetical protein